MTQKVAETITPLLTPASQIKPQRMRWLWSHNGHGIIPLGTLTIIAGYGAEGKSTFILDLVARLSRGELEGDLNGQIHPSILFTPEDPWEFVTVPRLMAARANLDKIFQLQRSVRNGEVNFIQDLSFPSDTTLLESQLIESGAKIILIDPATQMMGNYDMNKAQDVRNAYAPLLEVAGRLEVAVIMVTHFNKGASSGRVQHKVSGSHGWRDLTRSLLLLAKDPENDERVLTQDKNNYGTGLGSWRFALESVEVEIAQGTRSEFGRVRFLGESDTTAGQLLERESADGDAEELNAAQQFVVDYIRAQPGQEAKAGDVIKAGKAEGFSEQQVKDARRRVKNPGVISIPVKGKPGRVWAFATLPPAGVGGSENP